MDHVVLLSPSLPMHLHRGCSTRLHSRHKCLHARGQAPNLENIVKSKQKALESELQSLTPAQLETRLTSVQPKAKPFTLLENVVKQRLKGFTAIIVEVSRTTPAESSESLAKRSTLYVTWGADAIAVRTDEEKSPDGVSDLAVVSEAVNVPVIRSDWIIHPLQIAETGEARGSAVKLVYAVLKKGAPAILRYAESLGLDTVMEVINLKELEEVKTLGISAYGINLSVGLSVHTSLWSFTLLPSFTVNEKDEGNHTATYSEEVLMVFEQLSIPGFRQDIAKSLIGQIPFGSYSIVGVSSQEEALEMRLAGADAVYIKQEVLERVEAKGNSSELFLQNLRSSLTGDD